ncbi:MAG: hypothetical protein EXR99_01275 [Gemmataceae bacterium]|nr:hypothetical protein [Gemmataceae bacterium]
MKNVFHLSWVGLLFQGALVFSQAPTGPLPVAKNRPVSPGAARDVEIVEKVLLSRKDYQVSLESLRTHYINVGELEKAKWAEEELLQFHRIPKQAYLLELDVPPPTLQAHENIPEANEYYRRAMQYKDKGWGQDYTDNQKRAEILFQQILSIYPNSDKISDAAYQLGDIYESRPYRQYSRSALYFERSFQWNPRTQLDSRLRSARIYDKYLNERNKALELYREVAQRELDPKRVGEAQKRMAELSGAPR